LEPIVTIRPIVVADLDQLTAMARQTFYDTFAGTCTEKDMQDFLDTHYTASRLGAELAIPGNHYYFAEVAGVPAGYLQFREDYAGFPFMQQWKALELKRIYVSKEFHGKGIAQKLMECVLEHAHKNNYEVVWLGVWEHNKRAQQFYYKYGFKDSGHTHDFPIGSTPQTDIWMWKFLSNLKVEG
jgi:diamine N-acetyltransferase